MLKSITLENFFSFKEPTTIPLNKGANLNVGINGSGKSNFFKALRLLHESVVGKDGLEALFLGEWGGFSSVANYGKNEKDYIKLIYEFDKDALETDTLTSGYNFRKNPIYELIIHKAGSTGYYLSERLYNESTSASTKKPFDYIKMENGRGVISVRRESAKKPELEHYPSKEKTISFSQKELVLRQLSEPNKYFPHFTMKRVIEGISVYNYFDTTGESPIRQLSSYTAEEKLSPNGANLVQVLQRVKNHHSLSYELIERMIGAVNPAFKDISFDVFNNKSLLLLREKNLNKSIPADHISDGTLRFLILMSIFYNPQRGKLILIDEPEIGLHPDMIHSVAKGIKYASENGSQLMINTHSPLLLNSFDLEDVFIFEKNSANQTLVHIYGDDDFPEIEAGALLGQMWLSGKLGGTRWQ